MKKYNLIVAGGGFSGVAAAVSAAPAYFCPRVRGLVAAAGVSVLFGPSEQRPARGPGRRADARPARVRDARDGAAGRLGGRGDRGVCLSVGAVLLSPLFHP